MFKNNTIRKHVIKFIDEKIDRAQVAHDEEVKLLEDQHQDDILNLQEKHEINKSNVFDKHIKSVLDVLQ